METNLPVTTPVPLGLRHEEILREHLPIFLDHGEEILEDPRLAGAHVSCAVFGCCYAGGRVDVPLCALLDAWSRGRLCGPCPRCGGLLRIHHLTGSSLSGSHYLRGICDRCPTLVAGRLPGAMIFGVVLAEGRKILREHPASCPGAFPLEEIPGILARRTCSGRP